MKSLIKYINEKLNLRNQHIYKADKALYSVINVINGYIDDVVLFNDRDECIDYVISLYEDNPDERDEIEEIIDNAINDFSSIKIKHDETNFQIVSCSGKDKI